MSCLGPLIVAFLFPILILLLDFNVNEFWNWTNINSYIQITVLFILGLMLIALLFSWVPGVISILGIIALLIDTSLSVPQFIQNWMNQTTYGMK
jgi:hypothetical protein